MPHYTKNRDDLDIQESMPAQCGGCGRNIIVDYGTKHPLCITCEKKMLKRKDFDSG